MAQAAGADWILCFDADERYEVPREFNFANWDALRMKLFDFYITPEDADKPYTARRWCGPEFRAINLSGVRPA